MKPGFVIPHNVVGNTLTLGVAPHAFTPGSSDPADPNFEKKNKGEYDCHYLHIHFRQKSSDIIANTKIHVFYLLC